MALGQCDTSPIGHLASFLQHKKGGLVGGGGGGAFFCSLKDLSGAKHELKLISILDVFPRRGGSALWSKH